LDAFQRSARFNPAARGTDRHAPTNDSQALRPLMRGMHRWNIKKTYLELAK